jgi:hypothetical protein
MRRAVLCAFVLLSLGCQPTEPGPKTRIVLFGDSNTSVAWKQDGTLVGASYIDPYAPALATAPNWPEGLAGKIEALDPSIKAVNHSLAGVGSGDARRVSRGVMRFEAEVLGMGYPWDDGTDEQHKGIPRVNAYEPGANDYAYISLGTNDGNHIVTATNIQWMIALWSKHNRPDHLFVTTLAPAQTGAIVSTNDDIRAIVESGGAQLIDLAAYTSNDNGQTWRSPTLNYDNVHYTESVRAWIASEVVKRIRAQQAPAR